MLVPEAQSVLYQAVQDSRERVSQETDLAKNAANTCLE